jgi:hypothetical protein
MKNISHDKNGYHDFGGLIYDFGGLISDFGSLILIFWGS